MFRVAAAAAAAREAEGDEEAAESNDDEEEELVDAWGDAVGPNDFAILDDNIEVASIPDADEDKAGYTPFEFIDFTDIPLKHELVMKVDRPVSEVYALWANRLNWPEWFGMIEEVGFLEDEEDVCALNLWYRWGMTPWLELYVALHRVKAEVNKYILEEPVDGAPIVAAVLFQEDEGEGEGGVSTVVTLRVSYLLPRVLFDFAGTLAVYSDVNRKLARSMERMKEWVEEVDFQEVMAAAQQNMEELRAEMPEHSRKQQEYYEQWHEEQRRLDEIQQQQQQGGPPTAASYQDDGEAPSAARPADAGAESAADAASRGPASKKAASGAATNPMAKRRTRKPGASDL